jgi:hypothetical protein
LWQVYTPWHVYKNSRCGRKRPCFKLGPRRLYGRFVRGLCGLAVRQLIRPNDWRGQASHSRTQDTGWAPPMPFRGGMAPPPSWSKRGPAIRLRPGGGLTNASFNPPGGVGLDRREKYKEKKKKEKKKMTRTAIEVEERLPGLPSGFIIQKGRPLVSLESVTKSLKNLPTRRPRGGGFFFSLFSVKHKPPASPCVCSLCLLPPSAPSASL